MQLEDFRQAIAPITAAIAGRPVDGALQQRLESAFPSDGTVFEAVEEACRQGIAAGWLCPEGGPGRRFGRVLEPGPETHALSVDVVNVTDTAGPHHRHPRGEILMIMPMTPTAKFDGRGRGWLVYEPGTAHRPTVSDGEAVVLYLLPDGAIEWSGD